MKVVNFETSTYSLSIFENLAINQFPLVLSYGITWPCLSNHSNTINKKPLTSSWSCPDSSSSTPTLWNNTDTRSKTIQFKNYCIFNSWSISVVNPPLINTVTKTMTSVQVKINCRTSVSVLRMARAKAIAPLSPVETQFKYLQTHPSPFKYKTLSILTSKHQHMLESPAYLPFTTKVEEEWYHINI